MSKARLKPLPTFTRAKILNPCKFHWKNALTDMYSFSPKIYGFDPFRGCLHNCSYCWLKVLNKRFKNIKPDNDFTKLELCENVTQMLEKELPKLPKNHIIIACNATDLFQPVTPFQITLDHHSQLLSEWIDALYHCNVLFITKNGTGLSNSLKYNYFNTEKHVVGLTITTTRENEDLRKQYEPNSSSTWERYKALDMAEQFDLKKFVSIEPPLMNPREITEEIIHRNLGYNTWFVWGFANYSLKSLWSREDYLTFHNELLALREKYPYKNYRSKFFWKDECLTQIEKWLEVTS